MSIHPYSLDLQCSLRGQCPTTRLPRLAIPLLLALLVSPGFPADQPKEMTPGERNAIETMLTQISSDLVNHYYDPKLHGVDWEARVTKTREQIKNEKSINMAMSHVAAALDSLNDSHTSFIPPPRPYFLDHGWNIQMIGDKCYVTRVRPGGDAEKHGVQPGDQVVAINGYRVTRANLWKIEYTFNRLRPQPQLLVTLRSPEGTERKAVLQATFEQRSHVQDLVSADEYGILLMAEEDWMREQRIRTASHGDALLIARVKSFLFDESELNRLVSSSRKHNALILDLRGNGGGAVDLLKLVVSALFDHEVKVYDRVGRESARPLIAKPTHHGFQGKLIVLVDSNSASAAELLARVVQLEKRGVVLGDVSSGSVMEAKTYTYNLALGIGTFCGASITDANLITADGKSLEHVGITPDELVVPTADDLAHGRDPVLAHAAALAGVKLSPEDAGRLFPYEWPKYNPLVGGSQPPHRGNTLALVRALDQEN